jgi:hypothetical protein
MFTCLGVNELFMHFLFVDTFVIFCDLSDTPYTEKIIWLIYAFIFSFYKKKLLPSLYKKINNNHFFIYKNYKNISNI